MVAPRSSIGTKYLYHGISLLYMLQNLQGTEAGKMQLFSEELLGLPARGVAQHRAGYWDCHFHIRHLA